MNTPALLLVHGYPFDHTLWDHVIPLLDNKIMVLAPDLRGFGGPDPNAAEPSLDLIADDLNALLRQQNVSRIVIAGMSMGGYIALAFASRYQELLAGLALISSQSAADTDQARAARREMIQKVRAQGPDVAAQAAISKLFAAESSPKSELIRFPTLGAEKAGVSGITWALEAMARRPDRTDLLRALRIPFLILHGTEDQFIPVERARDLSKGLANCRYVEIPNAGHATPLEDPGRVAEALSELVRRSFAER